MAEQTLRMKLIDAAYADLKTPGIDIDRVDNLVAAAEAYANERARAEVDKFLELIGADLVPMDNAYNIIVTRYKRELRAALDDQKGAGSTLKECPTCNGKGKWCPPVAHICDNKKCPQCHGTGKVKE